MSTAGRMQIGEVAEQIGLSLRTIRYYEEVGLAVPSARSEGGFRLYVADDVERLRVIMQVKPLGFSLEEIAELLEMVEDDGAADRAGRAAEYLARARHEREKLARYLAQADELIAGLESIAST